MSEEKPVNELEALHKHFNEKVRPAVESFNKLMVENGYSFIFRGYHLTGCEVEASHGADIVLLGLAESEHIRRRYVTINHLERNMKREAIK